MRDLPTNQIIASDAIALLQSLPDNSVDAIITDPPYGINVEAWDKPIDIELFMGEAKRVSRHFLVFFGQMPTLTDWLNAAQKTRLHYLEHITWAKRNATPVGAKRLSRSHEEILIYATGKTKAFYSARGLYQDVKLPGILVDTVTLESVYRYIGELQRWTRTGKPVEKSSGAKRQEMFNSPTRLVNISSQTQHDANFTNVWSFRVPTQSAGRHGKGDYKHPNEKPVEVMKRLVEMCSPAGGTVLDPFMGSGTTAVACLETGRKFIGSEREATYRDIAETRIAQFAKSA